MGTDSALDRMCALRMRTDGTFHVYTRLLAILVGRRNHTDSDGACDFDGLKGGCGRRNAHVASSKRRVLVAKREMLAGVDWSTAGHGSDSSEPTNNCGRAGFDRAQV